MKDRVVVVTGGASGIGKACCRLFAQAGALVVVADIAVAEAERLAAEIGGQAAHLDVADEASVSQAVASTVAEHGGVDVLVNSAGVIQAPLPPQQLAQADWDRVVAVDLRGVYLCCAGFGARMAERRRGAIVNIASTAGMLSMPLHAYGPAKSAVIALTRSLAAEWGHCDVRVNAVSPGFTLTPALKAAFDAGTRDPEVILKQLALNRIVEPTDIAETVFFLASDAARCITGINLPVDAGFAAGAGWGAFGGLRR